MVLLTAVIFLAAAAAWPCLLIRRIRMGHALTVAIQSKDTREALNLLASGADPNARATPEFEFTWRSLLDGIVHPRSDAERQTAATALQLAAISNDTELVKSLLSHGADANAMSGYWPIIDSSLVSSDAARKPAGTYGRTALMDACLVRNPEMVKLLLENGANPNLYVKGLDTPLTVALSDLQLEPASRVDYADWAQTERQSVVRTLIEHGENVHIPGETEQTPIALASYVDWADVSLMLQRGADPNTICDNRTGATLLIEACTFEDLDVVRFLIAHGAKVNATDLTWRSPLLELCHRHMADSDAAFLEALKLLLKNGANPNWQDQDGNTALMEAAGDGARNAQHLGPSLEAIQLLLAHGADAHLRDKDGKTALSKLRPTHPLDEYGNRAKRVLEAATR